MSTLCVVDLETAGLTLAHPTIQIAAIAVDQDLRELDTFEVKIKFDISAADPEALKVNSYRANVWEVSAYNECASLKMFAHFLSQHADVEMMSKRTGRPYKVARLAAYNKDFDDPRLKNHFNQNNMFLPAHPQCFCIRQMASWWFHWRPDALRPENHKLTTLAKYFGVEVPGDAHDAMVDARLSIGIMKAMRDGK